MMKALSSELMVYHKIYLNKIISHWFRNQAYKVHYTIPKTQNGLFLNETKMIVLLLAIDEVDRGQSSQSNYICNNIVTRTILLK